MPLTSSLAYCCANDLNIGDYLSMRGVQLLLGLPGREVLMQGNVNRFRASLGELGERDSLVIGGGGLLKDHFAKYWDVIFEVQRDKQLRIYNLGIGVCDIKGKQTVLGAPALAAIVERAELSFLRPEIPATIAGHGRVRETFCPSEAFVAARHPAVATATPPRRLLYVHHERLVGPDAARRIKDTVAAICSARGIDYAETDNMIQDRDDLACLSRYQAADVVVTSRLHGYVLAHALGVPAVAISNDHKLEGYARRLGDVPPLDLGFTRDELEARILAPRPPALDRDAVCASLRACADELRAHLGHA